MVWSRVSYGDLERLRWRSVSRELLGRIVSFEELKRLFSEINIGIYRS